MVLAPDSSDSSDSSADCERWAPASQPTANTIAATAQNQ